MNNDNILRIAALVGAVIFVAWPMILAAFRSAVDAISSIRLGSRPVDDATLAVDLVRRLRAAGNTKAAAAAKTVLDLILNDGASK